MTAETFVMTEHARGDLACEAGACRGGRAARCGRCLVGVNHWEYIAVCADGSIEFTIACDQCGRWPFEGF